MCMLLEVVLEKLNAKICKIRLHRQAQNGVLQ